MASSEKRKRERVTKNSIPEGFTLNMAIVDAIPVLFFGIDCILIGRILKSPLFLIGAALCLLAGAAKVLWKVFVAVKRKNLWYLFVQMRILMPIGFFLMILAFFVTPGIGERAALLSGIAKMPSVIFLVLGVLGMILMTVFAFALDNGNKKANWIEQLTNGAAQICFFFAILLIG